jgi:hypothetical protein
VDRAVGARRFLGLSQARKVIEVGLVLGFEAALTADRRASDGTEVPGQTQLPCYHLRHETFES